MLACIACAKPELEEDGGDATTRTATPSSKGLTSQLKDILLKFSGTHRQSKGVGGSNPYQHKGHRRHRSAYLHPHYEDEPETVPDQRDQYSYLRAGSSSSTPAWDFGGGGGSDSRFNSTNWSPREAVDVTVIDDSTEPKEWMAQVEPGVHITFVSLPGGTGNDLKRVRFNREMFNKWQAQKWWGENYDRIMELYNVQRFSRQALHTPSRSDDGERESFFSRVGSTRESSSRPMGMRGEASSYYLPSVPDPSEHILPYYHNPAAALGGAMKVEATSIEASRTTTSSRDEAPSISISNASDLEMTEWVEQDEPGVYITIRELADGTRELRRVRFSRERFAEMNAKLWWEENFERIQAQYL